MVKHFVLKFSSPIPFEQRANLIEQVTSILKKDAMVFTEFGFIDYLADKEIDQKLGHNFAQRYENAELDYLEGFIEFSENQNWKQILTDTVHTLEPKLHVQSLQES